MVPIKGRSWVKSAFPKCVLQNTLVLHHIDRHYSEKSKLLEVVPGQIRLINSGLNQIKQIYLFHTFLNLKILRYTVNLQDHIV